jgi:uncharacterized protein YdhG (YjbR/CyaY superfamily)
MPDASGDRSRFFPAIERKQGGPISMWVERLAELRDAKYPEQIAYLRENHGFSQAHANALVMFARNSPTSKRFANPEAWFAAADPRAAATASAIFAAVTKNFPGLELVIAWNHPMLRTNGQYVFGLSAARRHLLLNPFSAEVLDALGDRLSGYTTNKRTFQVPLDWEIDETLLRDMVDARLAELDRAP